MKTYKIDEMTKGWFVGNFEPTAIKSEAAEVAVKTYSAGDIDDAHYHKIATEVTVVLYGNVMFNDQSFSKGDVIVVEPGEVVLFRAITDAANVVVKVPGATNDKYTV